MQQPKVFSLILLAICGLGLAVLASCVPSGYGDPSLEMENARATLAAANAYLERTSQAQQSQAQQATLAAAQTRDAIHLTATAVSAYATATQAAADSRATQTQQAADLLATQSQATASASAATAAWLITQTPLAATQQAIIRQQNWDQWVVTPARTILPVVFSTVTGIMLLLWAWRAAPKIGPRLLRLLEAGELRLRTIISPDGEMVTFLPRSDEVDVIQPKRNFGAAMRQGPEGISVEGMAPDYQLQADTTARQQAAVLADHLPAGRRNAPRDLLQTMPSTVRVIAPNEALPPNLLAEPDILNRLDAQWRDENNAA